jgi:diamine N-acetyltransferase
MTVSPRLEPVTPENVGAACRLQVAPGQEKFVAPVAHSLAEAYVNQDSAWPRLVVDGDQVVGFVMAGFSADPPHEAFRCGIWRLAISADAQGRGYGRFAVRGVLEEARRRGERRVTVSWVPGEGSPEEFYLRLGFRPTGEKLDEEIIGELFLDVG